MKIRLTTFGRISNEHKAFLNDAYKNVDAYGYGKNHIWIAKREADDNDDFNSDTLKIVANMLAFAESLQRALKEETTRGETS